MEDSEKVTFELVTRSGVWEGRVTLALDAITQIEVAEVGSRAIIHTSTAFFHVADSGKGIQARVHRHMADKLEAEAAVDSFVKETRIS